MHRLQRMETALILRLLPAAAATVAPPRIHAQDCPACTEMQVAALARDCKSGYSYVSDFPDGRFYKVCHETNPDGTVSFRWRQPEPAYMKVFQAYLDVYRLNGHHQSMRAAVHADIPMPATSSPADPEPRN